MAKIDNQKILYAAFLTPQGKYLYDFFIHPHEDTLLLDIEVQSLKPLMQKLTLYKLRSDVILKDVSENFSVVLSKSAEEGLSPDPRCAELGYRGISQNNFEKDETLIQKYDLSCLELGVPTTHEMKEGKGIPLECGLDDLNAIDWDKGCYMGQELTARTRYRGLVRKRLFPITSDQALEDGASLFLNDKKAGEVRTFRDGVGIAMVRLEAAKLLLEGEGDLVTDSGETLALQKPSWMSWDESAAS